MTILHDQQLAVRSLLQATGMTQTAISQALDVTQPTVSRWLARGSIRQENLDALRSLARQRGQRLSLDRPRLAEAAAELALRVQDLDSEMQRHDARMPAVMLKCATRVLSLLTESS